MDDGLTGDCTKNLLHTNDCFVRFAPTFWVLRALAPRKCAGAVSTASSDPVTPLHRAPTVRLPKAFLRLLAYPIENPTVHSVPLLSPNPLCVVPTPPVNPQIPAMWSLVQFRRLLLAW